MTTPPTRPALRRRYDAKREGVVEAAAELFAERGYHATTMQDLTEATGLTAGGLYHYIGSREQLLIAICDALVEPLLERGWTASGSTRWRRRRRCGRPSAPGSSRSLATGST